MRALTIRSPWIDLILAGEKRYEYRTWSTRWRGPLVLHVALRRDMNAPTALLERYSYTPLGCLVAVCMLADVERLGPGRAWAWHLRDVMPFAEPLPWRGQQGLWEVANDIIRPTPLQSART